MSNGKLQWTKRVLREKYREGQLSDDQIARLNAIGFDFQGRLERLKEEREPLLEFVRCNPGSYSCPELAKRFGMTTQKCYSLLYTHDAINFIKPCRRYVADEDVPDILADYDNGMSRYELCCKYDMSDSALGHLLKDNQRRRLKRVDQKIRDEIVRLRIEGRTRDEIAQSVGFKPSTISRVLRDVNMPFVRHSLSKSEIENIRQLLYDGGMTYADIGERVGVSGGAVGEVARRIGLNNATRGHRLVRCLETGEVFRTTKAAAQSVNPNAINGSCVIAACKNGNMYHGYHWQYVDESNGTENEGGE